MLSAPDAMLGLARLTWLLFITLAFGSECRCGRRGDGLEIRPDEGADN
jgi:hypothetical protein